VDDDPVISFGGAQLGDMSAGGVAGGNLTNIRVSSEQAITLIAADVQALTARLELLERIEGQHTNERQAMTRLITMLAAESRTVSDVQALLERQIDSEAAERSQRRRYLDTMLSALIVLAFLNLGLHIYRVFRRSGRAAQP
jgi:hypothetical protein